MDYGLYVSAAGALANAYRQDVIANNLANTDTIAFKRDLALMQERRTAAEQAASGRSTHPLLERIGGGIFALPTYTDFAGGPLAGTGRPYDLALADDGFFTVQKGDQKLYTRDGRFALNQANQLVTSADHLPVLDDAGDPIRLDPGRGFAVAANGQIEQDGEQIAHLAVVDFADRTKLEKQGDNLYAAPADLPGRPVDTPVMQAMLEGSGVEPLRQLTDMIRVQRRFQTNLSSLQIQDQTLQLAVTRLGSLS
ncbi:MAG: flagellar hook-basal body protein [Sedimentisphaerales bacterium]|nr:flagellar hook-basal body protein [Sedimentisphaerales bacterium]